MISLEVTIKFDLGPFPFCMHKPLGDLTQGVGL